MYRITPYSSILRQYQKIQQASIRLVTRCMGSCIVPFQRLPKKKFLNFNPYRQIPETISKKRAVTQGIFRKLFPGKFHEYLPMKKYFFPKTGHDSEAFPETFSNIWKKFPEILLGHYPNLRKFKFHFKSQILENVSGKSPESFPKIVKIASGKSFRKIP